MVNNKLRRAIEQEQRASYDQPHEKIAAQSALLTRALMALGGPVDSERPPQVTDMRLPSMQTGPEWSSLPQQADGHNEVLEGIIVGRDLGDESDTPHTPTEAEMADIGRPEDPSEYCP